MIKRILMIVALSTAATSAFGADSSSGCGPAWYIFKENTLVSSALRFTTNGILSPVVTLGMTFGTSNCAQHKIVLNDKRGLHFVTHNMHNLVSATATGQGEHLSVLATTFGCDWRVQDQFNTAMQSNFDMIFGDAEPTAEAVHSAMLGVVATQPTLASSCTVVQG